jgi:pimeloyl-ACP methyl ester carboxylesterase
MTDLRGPAGEGASFELRASDGAVLRLARLGRPGARRVLLSHGVGLAAWALRAFWGYLLDDHEVFLLDLRGHGANHALPGAAWPRLARDVAEAAAHLRASAPPDGVFHSFSGVLALHAEAAAPGSFGRLVLFEPPLAPAPGMPLHDASREDGRRMAGRALRRRRRFDDPAEFERIFRERDEFRALDPQAPRDLAASLLVPEGGGWTLACAPEREAALYAGNEDGGLWPRLGAVAAPTLLVSGRRPGGAPDLPYPDLPSEVAPLIARAGGFDHLALDGATHLLPLERPAFLAGLSRAFLAAG